MTEYCFVLDKDNKKLSPTNVNNGWRLIRRQKAELVSRYPMAIKLKKVVKDEDTDKSEFSCGIDTGSIYTGIAIVQRCSTGNKPVFKGTLEHRQDVKQKMEIRRGYRRYKRSNKRYRKARFDNRSASKRINRAAPSILQKKQAIVRVLNSLNKYINISKVVIEDVAIDIRALTEGCKLYKWQYQQSNRLDENIRKAVILRDKCKCMECSRSNTKLEVHHIVPKRSNGKNNLGNLITLCSKCHDETKGREEQFINKYQEMTDGKNIRFDYAQHVMQGKNWLRKELSKQFHVEFTFGSDTANKRIDWNIEKTHANDAICIAGLEVNERKCGIKDWTIKTINRRCKSKLKEEVCGFRHRDYAEYTDTKGVSYTGYVTAMYPELNAININSPQKHLKKANAEKCKLVWRFNKIYWF